MEAEDLLAASWPALAACQENAAPGPGAGPRPRAGAPDGDRLPDRAPRRRRPGGPAARSWRPAGSTSTSSSRSEPSPLAHGILTGRPYTFLDGAPLEERRTRAVPVPRGLGPLGPDGLPPGLPVAASELGPLDPAAAAEVLDQVRPRPRGRRRAPRLLLSLVLCRPVPELAALVRRPPAPTGGPAWSAGAGRPPSGGRWPRRRPLADRPDGRRGRRRWPSAWAATSKWPDR